MTVLYLVTGSCPQTEGEARLEMADIYEAQGDQQSADQYRSIVEQMHAEWDDRSEVGRARRALTARAPGPDPDAIVEPLGTPEHPLFWHEPHRDDSIVCPCGHFSTHLCDEPLGKGRTCDRGICECCRVEVVDGIDQCDFHARTQPRAALDRLERP